MARNNKKSNTSKKKTTIGRGGYSKTSHSGGETFHGGHRAGTPPPKAHKRKKAYRGQGR